MDLTAGYDAILREKQQYDLENGIDSSSLAFMDIPSESSLELSVGNPKRKVTKKVVPKKVIKKEIKKPPLKPDKTLTETPRPPLMAAENIPAVDNSKDFIKEFTPIVDHHAKRLGLSTDLMLAQIALETGWGKNAPGFNFGGQKVGKDWKGQVQTFLTKEFEKGKGLVTKQGEQFRSYKSAAEGIKGYFDFFKSYDRYKPVFGIADPYKGAEAMQKTGYATDPKYAKKLKAIIDTVKRLRKENDI